MANPLTITAFYKFLPIEDVEALQSTFYAKGEDLGMYGLILVAEEGINGTIAGSADAIDAYKAFLQDQCGEITFKDSVSTENPFKRWFVKIRKEIVAIGDPDMHPESTENCHLSPTEWNEVLESGEDVVVLDTRNDYETEIGVFEGATDPKLKQFSDFPKWVEKSDIPKDKKVLMYCTGGIRCEKALIEMQNQGFKQVFQLKGGILQYLKEFPRKHFNGECFVFDHRTSVNQDLEPSTHYTLCPHTGDPADVPITCTFCGKHTQVAAHSTEEQKEVCSKDCKFRLMRSRAKSSS